MWLNDVAIINHTTFDAQICSSLTSMADYRLPQVLMEKGVIVVSDDIMRKLQVQLIDKDLEYIIRATTIYSCMKIAEKCNLCEARVDRILWGMSQDLLSNGKMSAPMMRVATNCY